MIPSPLTPGRIQGKPTSRSGLYSFSGAPVLKKRACIFRKKMAGGKMAWGVEAVCGQQRCQEHVYMSLWLPAEKRFSRGVCVGKMAKRSRADKTAYLLLEKHAVPFLQA
jgi:hypothetical protein